jgi:hypothetical protein
MFFSCQKCLRHLHACISAPGSHRTARADRDCCGNYPTSPFSSPPRISPDSSTPDSTNQQVAARPALKPVAPRDQIRVPGGGMTGAASQAYGEAWYWDERYRKEAGPFDWYQKYPALAPLLRLYVRPHQRLLLVGCGNSGEYHSHTCPRAGIDDQGRSGLTRSSVWAREPARVISLSFSRLVGSRETAHWIDQLECNVV